MGLTCPQKMPYEGSITQDLYTVQAGPYLDDVGHPAIIETPQHVYGFCPQLHV